MPEQDEGKFVGPLSKRGYLTFLAVLFGIGAIATTGLVLARRQPTLDDPPKDGISSSSNASDGYKAFVGKYLRDWPADRKPEMILLFSGQQHNYLSPCGCTEPQSGGLERRYNLFSQLRGFGVPTVAMDLGDIYTDEAVPIRDQEQLKYFVSMKALGIMDYDAVNIGPEEFQVTLSDINGFLANLKTPYSVLAANLANKVDTYPNANVNGSVFEDFRVAQPKGSDLKIGVTGTLGQSAIDEIVKKNPTINPKVVFENNGNNGIVLPKVLNEMKPKSPAMRVLLYQGTREEAEKLAQAIDEFDIILYRTDQSDPPSQSSRAKAAAGKPQPKAQLVTVGHKGRWIGVLGVFRNADKSLDLQWEVVLLDPSFKTPPGNRANHPIVKLLEDYTLKLKDNDYLAKYLKGPLPTIGKNLQMKYLGSEACKKCHAKEYDIWSETRHASAYETLVEKAKYPENRQFDPECVVCHTVGYKHKTGFRDNEAGYVTAEKSKHLFGVGCENCHGPGNLHADDPKNKDLLARMSPWKSNPNDHLTKSVVLTDKLNDNDPQKMAVPANEKRVGLRVFQMCINCHDTDNDHNYSLDKWKKIAHGSVWDPEKK